ncbi:hypothetical protein L2E82_33803 [Cichorium intybus]|uniref:Uncharacterized protein n=1 Tax=Cichorium intybus TaxID=13427 RepID=A0ACB9BLG8_CICIN|nr:hypothetical protein L2E82_33803 [Cichorium intybus]
MVVVVGRLKDVGMLKFLKQVFLTLIQWMSKFLWFQIFTVITTATGGFLRLVTIDGAGAGGEAVPDRRKKEGERLEKEKGEKEE